MSVMIEPMRSEHIEQIRHIEHQAHTHPWSDQHLNDIQGRFACHHVLLKDNRVIGYYYAQNIAGEMTLLNIAVAPNEQGSGYGACLLRHLLDDAHSNHVESIWLEVRESNHKAIGLYSRFEFNEVTRRFGYYPSVNGREDAVVMTCTL